MGVARVASKAAVAVSSGGRGVGKSGVGVGGGGSCHSHANACRSAAGRGQAWRGRVAEALSEGIVQHFRRSIENVEPTTVAAAR